MKPSFFYYLHIDTSHQNTYFGKFSGQHGEAVDDTAVVGAVNGEFLESGIDILLKTYVASMSIFTSFSKKSLL